MVVDCSEADGLIEADSSMDSLRRDLLKYTSANIFGIYNEVESPSHLVMRKVFEAC